MLSLIFDKVFRRRRRLAAVYVRPDWEQLPAAHLREKVWRWVFKPEHCDMDGKTARFVRRLRLWAVCAFLGALVWFIYESFRCWDVFSG
jgi:hypothetical protein